jgi:hypothetical protein
MPTQAKLWAFGLGLLVVSFLVGNAVAEGDYATLGLMVLLILVTATIVMPGYEPILAFGILCPFAFPIPYVYRFPFFVLVLALCCVKFIVTQALSQQRFRYHRAVTAPILILFGWVVLRYCMNPVMPGLAIGTGSTVTGFRAYLNYAVCLGLLLALPLFIKTREDAVRLLRWLAYISLLFVALLIPLTLSKSLTAARILTNLGMTVLFSAIFSGIELIWDRQFGFLKETLVAPVPRLHIMAGRTLGGATIAMIQGTLVLVVCIIAGFRPQNLMALPLAFVFMALVAIVFAAMGTVIGSSLRDILVD